ncbi:MAG: IS30 family transposase [Deltaproteobacteria bacterium]|nr:IS30 family transposase [Deltaproteobacteria bacterium]
MKHYTQLTQEERYTISILRKQGLSNPEIARMIGRHRSTIYREIRRNKCRDNGYRPFKASKRTRGRRSRSRRNCRFGKRARNLVFKYIRDEWSPDQISNVLRNEGRLHISHETIYKWIRRDRKQNGILWTHLRQAGKKRRKRRNAPDSRGILRGKRPIEDRPIGAKNSSRVGHLEIDTVKGKGSKDCILTAVDRKSMKVWIGKMKDGSKKELNRALMLVLSKCSRKTYTLTPDNGCEFHGYEEIEKMTEVKFYFANPYHPWERALNENTNGLIRQYIPKGTSMEHLTQTDCNRIARKLNNRPRRKLGYKTPEECYETM